MDGWIKLHRRLIETGWLQNHKVLVFWIYSLLKASHQPIKMIVGFQEVQLEPGQFIFGRRKAAEETKLSEQEIRTCIGFLKKAQNLTIKSTNKFSIISIVNWHAYQNLGTGYQPAKQPAFNQQPTTNKNRTPKEEKTLRDSSDQAFKQFYRGYPKKKAPRDAEKAWSKLDPSPELVQTILNALENHKRSEEWKRESGKFIPYPATWLNGHRWEDEVETKGESRWNE